MSLSLASYGRQSLNHLKREQKGSYMVEFSSNGSMVVEYWWILNLQLRNLLFLLLVTLKHQLNFRETGIFSFVYFVK